MLRCMSPFGFYSATRTSAARVAGRCTATDTIFAVGSLIQRRQHGHCADRYSDRQLDRVEGGHAGNRRQRSGWRSRRCYSPQSTRLSNKRADVADWPFRPLSVAHSFGCDRRHSGRGWTSRYLDADANDPIALIPKSSALDVLSPWTIVCRVVQENGINADRGPPPRAKLDSVKSART
jgi:hypothetical protein